MCWTCLSSTVTFTRLTRTLSSQWSVIHVWCKKCTYIYTCYVQSIDALMRPYKNVILWIIKGSLSLFAFSLSWQLPGDSLVAICHLAGARLRCQPIRPPGAGHMVTSHHQPRGGVCEPLTSGLRSASDTRLLVIYSNHQNTSVSLYFLVEDYWFPPCMFPHTPGLVSTWVSAATRWKNRHSDTRTGAKLPFLTQ